jgi:hypothetical protein
VGLSLERFPSARRALEVYRRGHYELGVEARHEQLRLAAAFDELADAI